MTPEFKKILFTTDLSNESRIAFDYAVSLANRYGGQITILHVMEEVSRTSSYLLTTYLGKEKLREIRDSQKKDAQQAIIGKKKEGLLIKEALTAFCSAAQNDHAECQFIMDDIEIVIAAGDVVEEILAQARDCKSDVIVMGYHSRSKLESIVIGSTSQRLLHSSHVPVLLVRLNE